MKKEHVSFSEVHLYHQCKFRHYIEYTLGNRGGDTVHTVFGNAVHEAIDRVKKGQDKKIAWITMGKTIAKFIKKNPVHTYVMDGEEKSQDLDYKEWVCQGFSIYSEVFDWIDNHFPNHTLIDSEMKLYEDTRIEGIKFKGFIDLIILDEDGIYHVIDFKTSNWGWNREKRSDTKKQYQISLYKNFFCSKENIDPKKVKTHFLILKRNPPKNSSACELITVTSGPKKLLNATEWMEKQAKGIRKGLRLKNRTSCKFCPWQHTKLCP